ncbi:MAG: rRNA maturation RNase YbeY [Deltaproteobacteria bacterium HGW-Deltaproteobacteria-7]|jgi:probable rRNA maturation factor|nr:MAG: rRNA maturation RNase YbeY [Deltaproteobacteria bacterium HGW-Deltaproteobacteria-7]PKN52227.1 MAG: rRNA maturation RNase YbeY [Deltaproteobacteria bacterium HGW-Deltaproteobacteria-13]
MRLQIENKQTQIKLERRKIRGTVLRILKILNCADKEISISFVDDEGIKQLNKQYLGKDKSTNVLSFSLQEGEYGNINPQILGDIVISTQTALRDAVKGKLTVEQEIDFLMIHGILHLLGYNHENTTKEETKKMRQKEKELFNEMNFRNKVLI